MKPQLTFYILLLLFLVSKYHAHAQISYEQQVELSKYEKLVTSYKNQEKYKMVGYYLYKSAGIYLGAGEQQNAIDKYLESAQYYELLGNYNNKKKIYSNVAFVYADMGQLKNAKKYYNKSLEISRRLNNRNDISASLMEVANIEIYLQDYSNAQSDLDEALKIANILNDATLLRTCYLLLHQLYKAKGNIKKADENYNNYLVYDQKINGERVVKESKLEDKKNKAEKENAQILSDKNETMRMQYRLLELKKKLAEDSLANSISTKDDSISKIENSKIVKINELLKQESKLQEKEGLYQRKAIDRLEQQLFIMRVWFSFLIILFIGVLTVFLQKRKSYKQLEFKLGELEMEITKMRNINESKDNINS